MLENLIQSKVFTLFISIVWGLGLATLFQKTCKGKNCKIIQYKGPDTDWLNNAVFNYGTSDCYKYKPILTQCS